MPGGVNDQIIRQLLANQDSDENDGVPVECPECGTKTYKPTFDEAVDLAVEHDEDKHDGRGVVKVKGMAIPSDDLADAVGDALDKIEF